MRDGKPHHEGIEDGDGRDLQAEIDQSMEAHEKCCGNAECRKALVASAFAHAAIGDACNEQDRYIERQGRGEPQLECVFEIGIMRLLP